MPETSKSLTMNWFEVNEQPTTTFNNLKWMCQIHYKLPKNWNYTCVLTLRNLEIETFINTKVIQTGNYNLI